MPVNGENAAAGRREAMPCGAGEAASGAGGSVIDESLLFENLRYWTGRAAGYSRQNRNELATARRDAWLRELVGPADAAFPGVARSRLRVLDVGCGPGLFSILLASAGFPVTAVDCTPAMLDEARANAGRFGGRIRFERMDAERLAFADGSFDVVVSRNLTWNLPHPCRALGEWHRVLAAGGLLLNFDANWYNYLYDDDPDERDQTRGHVADRGVDGSRIDTDVAAMERIARRVPLSGIVRPLWDRCILGELGMDVRVDEDLPQRIWTPEERANFAATPMFKVIARK